MTTLKTRESASSQDTMWSYRNAGFKAQGLPVYEVYFYGEFSHYAYRKPVYQLRQEKTLNGIVTKEVRLRGKWQYQYFYREKNQTWEQFASYWKNYDDALIESL